MDPNAQSSWVGTQEQRLLALLSSREQLDTQDDPSAAAADAAAAAVRLRVPCVSTAQAIPHLLPPGGRRLVDALQLEHMRSLPQTLNVLDLLSQTNLRSLESERLLAALTALATPVLYQQAMLQPLFTAQPINPFLVQHDLNIQQRANLMDMQSILLREQMRNSVNHQFSLTSHLLGTQQQNAQEALLHQQSFVTQPPMQSTLLDAIAASPFPSEKEATLASRKRSLPRRARTSHSHSMHGFADIGDSPAQKDNVSTSSLVIAAAEDNEDHADQAKRQRRNGSDPFPKKLMRMIETAKKEGLQHLIAFTEDGTAVQTSSPFELEEQLFLRFFRHQNFASFKRQLSMYGFTRVLEGTNEGAYAHPLFLRDRPELVDQIKRQSETK